MTPTSTDALRAKGARIGGSLTGDALKIHGPFECQELQIGGDLILEGALVAGDVALIDLSVVRHASLKRAAFDGDVRLERAQIGGQLDLSESHFRRRALFPSIRVTEAVIATGASFGGEVAFEGAQLAQLTLSNIVFAATVSLKEARDGAQRAVPAIGVRARREFRGHGRRRGPEPRGREIQGEARICAAATSAARCRASPPRSTAAPT